jgi:hypothetical protein
MTRNEKNLAAILLKIARYEFSNHICNDVEDSVYDEWTIEERKQFVKEFYEWNGDPENYNENFLYIGYDSLMGFLAYKLINQ